MQVTFYIPEKDRYLIDEFKEVCEDQEESVSAMLVNYMHQVVAAHEEIKRQESLREDARDASNGNPHWEDKEY